MPDFIPKQHGLFLVQSRRTQPLNAKPLKLLGGVHLQARSRIGISYNRPVSDITQLLDAIGAGDPKAANQLLPLVYYELRKLAVVRMANEKAGQTLQPTALHEARVPESRDLTLPNFPLYAIYPQAYSPSLAQKNISKPMP